MSQLEFRSVPALKKEIIRLAVAAAVQLLFAIWFYAFCCGAVSLLAVLWLCACMFLPHSAAAMAVALSSRPLIPFSKERNWRSTEEMVAWRPFLGLVLRIKELVSAKS